MFRLSKRNFKIAEERYLTISMFRLTESLKRFCQVEEKQSSGRPFGYANMKKMNRLRKIFRGRFIVFLIFKKTVFSKTGKIMVDSKSAL